MFDRSAFWSPTPDWQQARLAGRALQLSALVLPVVWRLSGPEIRPALDELGLGQIVGPRDRCDVASYALRLAPDSVLLVCDAAASARLREFGDHAGLILSELSGGFVGIDLTGEDASELLQLASEYPFTSAADHPRESARMAFAGLPVAVMRRGNGWRLHAERPWATALWRWLVEHANHNGKGGLS